MLQPGFIELIKKDIILGEVRPGKRNLMTIYSPLFRRMVLTIIGLKSQDIV